MKPQILLFQIPLQANQAFSRHSSLVTRPLSLLVVL